MDTRKVTLVATIAVIALVAVGIGYAYTATTTNQGNNVNAEYITISQGETGAYTFAPLIDSKPQKVYWDVNDYKAAESSYKTVYTLTDNVEDLTINEVAYKAVQLGKPFTIKATHSSVADTEDSVTVTMSATSGFNYVAGYDIFFKIAPPAGDPTYVKLTADNVLQNWAGTADATFVMLKDGSGPNYKTATVTAYCGYPAATPYTVTRASTETAITGPSATPIVSGVLKFTIVDTGVNNPVTGISLSKTEMTLAASGSDTSVVTFTPDYTITDKQVILTSSDSTKVTASITGSTITVTASESFTTGSVTITVKSVTNPDVTATITVTYGTEP